MNTCDFLRTLFEHKPEDAGIGIFELPSKKAANFKDYQAAAKYVEGLDLDHTNIYFHCGILRANFDRHRRGNEDAVIGIVGFWADLDMGDHGNEKPYPPDLMSVQAVLEEFALRPSLIVFTGGGVHAYWLFKEPWIFTEPEEKSGATALCKRLQATLRGIAERKGGWTFDSTADLARILRPPGTYNNKPGRSRAKVEVLAETSYRYDPADFDDVMVEEGISNSEHPSEDEFSDIAKGLKADPWAQPPKDKFEHLIAANERFRLSWEGDRTGTERWVDTSASGFAMSLASHAAKTGWNKQEIADLIIAFYRKHRSSGVFQSPPSIEKATRVDFLARTITKAMASSTGSNNNVLTCLSLNEDGDAQLFVQEYRNKFAFDHTDNYWYVYRGHYWEKDKKRECLEAVKRIASAYSNESVLHAGKIYKELRARAFALGGHDRRTRVLKLSAAGRSGLGVTADIWDRHPHLLPCVNGVADLRTGSLLSGEPGNFIRNFCPTEYNPGAGPPVRFLQALNEMFDEDEEMIGYLQRLIGLSLIGEFREPVFPIFFGPSGQNGKTTIVETIGAILGPELAGPVSPELLLEQDRRKTRGAPSPEIMALMGRRFVWASEVNHGRSLDLSQVKMLTGGDQLVGRDPFGHHEVRFPPSHTIFLVTNTLPSTHRDIPYELRQQLIEFKYSYLDDPDPDDPLQRKAVRCFKENLLQERPEILRWAVEGSVAYLLKGLEVPGAVRCNYPLQVSSVDEFAKSRLEKCPGGRIGKTEAFVAYKDFCLENQRKPVTQRAFSRTMVGKFKDGRESDFRFYKDVRLVPCAAKKAGAAYQAEPESQRAAAR